MTPGHRNSPSTQTLNDGGLYVFISIDFHPSLDLSLDG